jgi:uncharacterized damage-inducible protein DinB
MAMFEYNFKLLAKYNKITNELMNDIIKNLSEEEWNKKFPTVFGSIHELCSHVYICDFNWLKRFKGLRDFDTLNKNLFEKNYGFVEIIFSTINEYIFMRMELDKIIIEFINELKEDDVKNVLKFTNSEGNKLEREMEALLIHMFNHETHHRGMISIFLELLGKENDYSSSIYKGKL